MTESKKRSPAILFLLFSCLSLVASAAADAASSSADGYTITGRIKLDGASSTGVILPGKFPNAKIILNGGQMATSIRPDGYFSFWFFWILDLYFDSHNVRAGTHLIEVAALGFLFSPVRVDISARNPGKIQAALTENRRVLQELVLEPLKEESYYETREAFNAMSFLKSPMGLMIGFMVLMMFVFPKMMENMDPEEIKKAQDEMRAQGVPSLSNLLARGTS